MQSRNFFKGFVFATLTTFSFIACDKAEDVLTTSSDSLVAADARGGGSGSTTTNGGKGTTVAAADVPAVVTTAFTTKYPSATSVTWTKNSTGTTYEAHFLIGTTSTHATFNADGTFVEEHAGRTGDKGGKGKGGDKGGKGGAIVATADVPAVVTTAFTTKYATATSVVWTKSSDGTTYEAHFLAGTTPTHATFNADGTFVEEHAGKTGGDRGGKGGATVAAADVPAVVTTAFTAKYATATSVVWTKSSDGTTYEAHFLVGTTPTHATFNADGTFVEEHAGKTGGDKGGKGGKGGKKGN